MAKRYIPQTAAELTPEWFSQTVGATFGASVQSVEREVVGAGVGFLGQLHRCVLTWEPGTPMEAPTSVVVKLPPTVAANKATGEATQAFEREIVVYRDLIASMGIPAPKFIYADLDPNPGAWLARVVLFFLTVLPVRAVNWLVLKFIKLSASSKRRYLLVMEDIADARPPNQVEGGSIADVDAALDVLAAFHGQCWMWSEVEDRNRLIWPHDQAPKVLKASYMRNRSDFVDRYASQLPPGTIARLDDAQNNITDIVEQLSAEPWTLLHGDFRLDNILFRPDGEIVVLDYQLVARGRAGFDVAYFITTALTVEHRSEESRMLRRYHDALVSAGVTDYSFDQLVSDVEVTKIALAHRFVCVLDTFDTQMEGNDETFVELMMQRVMGWID